MINRNKTENAASVEYVDTRDKELKTEVDKKVSRDEVQMILNQLKTIEGNQSAIQANQTAIYQILIQQKNK